MIQSVAILYKLFLQFIVFFGWTEDDIEKMKLKKTKLSILQVMDLLCCTLKRKGAVGQLQHVLRKLRRGYINCLLI